MADDPFEHVFNLEDRFYQNGYKQGMEDGVKAGRIEGRSLGLEKGFAKFLESGRLHGKAIVWANRLPGVQANLPSGSQPIDSHQPESSSEARRPGAEERGRHQDEQIGQDYQQGGLPPFPPNQRLEKNITTLYALVEPDSLSTDNSDEAVDDFDDRLKRAEGKAKVIEKMVGEGHRRDNVQESQSPARPKSAGVDI